MNSSGVYIFGACLLALIATSSAIKCYECNTANPDDICDDPFPVGQADTDKHIVDCKNSDDERDHKVCRKTTTIQYAVKQGGDNEEVARVVSRYCGGPEVEELECEEIEGDASMTYHCACNESGCNGSTAVLASISTVSAAVIGMALLTKLVTPF